VKWLIVAAAVLHEALAGCMADAAEAARLAVFDFELVDTSLQGEIEGVDPADAARLRMIETELRAQLAASGRFELVDVAPAADQVDAAGWLWSCNGCETAIARRLDADLALIGWVQKVSNLILNVNVVIRDTATRERVFATSVDIRGNTDESWAHGIRYLLKNRLLKE
jgi:Protein of unknown function (DUF2380)